MSRTLSGVRGSTLTWASFIKNACIDDGGRRSVRNGRYYVSISHPALDFPEKKSDTLRGNISASVMTDSDRQKRRRALAQGDKSDGRHVKWIF